MGKQINELEIAKVSSRGQLVIPQNIRFKMKIKEGSMFAVASFDKMLVLKKIDSPISEADKKTLKIVDEAWDDIEKGRYETASLADFMKQAERW